MTAQEFVLTKYPAAEACRYPPTFQQGQLSEYPSPEWSIYAAPGLGTKELGSGNTEKLAWADAAKRIRDEVA